MSPSLHLSVVQPEGLSSRGLFIGASLVATRAFQRDRVRRLRTALLLRVLRFWDSRFRGFAGMADVRADWVEHIRERSALSGEALVKADGVRDS